MADNGQPEPAELPSAPEYEGWGVRAAEWQLKSINGRENLIKRGLIRSWHNHCTVFSSSSTSSFVGSSTYFSAIILLSGDGGPISGAVEDAPCSLWRVIIVSFMAFVAHQPHSQVYARDKIYPIVLWHDFPQTRPHSSHGSFRDCYCYYYYYSRTTYYHTGAIQNLFSGNFSIVPFDDNKCITHTKDLQCNWQFSIIPVKRSGFSFNLPGNGSGKLLFPFSRQLS